MLRIGAELFHPLPQHILMNVQIACRLPNSNTALPHQLDSFKLELPRKLPSLHDPPPVPLNTLTWCLRNQGQASL
jgi:hypothetical protein